MYSLSEKIRYFFVRIKFRLSKDRKYLSKSIIKSHGELYSLGETFVNTNGKCFTYLGNNTFIFNPEK